MRRLSSHSSSFDGLETTCSHGTGEGLVVALCLVGIGDGKAPERLVEGGCIPEIAGEQGRVSRAGMCSREGGAAQASLVDEAASV